MINLSAFCQTQAAQLIDIGAALILLKPLSQNGKINEAFYC